MVERLQAEHAYEAGYTGVKDAVRAWRQQHKEVFLPLTHPPGEAQVDFGHALVKMGGVLRKVCFFVIVLVQRELDKYYNRPSEWLAGLTLALSTPAGHLSSPPLRAPGSEARAGSWLLSRGSGRSVRASATGLPSCFRGRPVAGPDCSAPLRPGKSAATQRQRGIRLAGASRRLLRRVRAIAPRTVVFFRATYFFLTEPGPSRRRGGPGGLFPAWRRGRPGSARLVLPVCPGA